MLTEAASLDFLGDPAWQGVGALAAIVAFGAYLWFETRRRNARIANPHYQIFDLSSEAEEREFYIALSKSIKGAAETIYRSGRGFSRPASDARFSPLLAAEEAALRNGVEITRVQTSTRAVEDWADAYARLMDRYPKNLTVLRDVSEPPLVNVALIDPYGANPIIQLLFEAQEVTPQGERHRGASAMFLYREPALAASLAQQFAARCAVLHRMSSDDVRDLARTYTYFAYGSNMSSRQMRERCPQAEDLGRAILYGWRRGFGVAAPHLDAEAAGIERADDAEHVEGVAYAVLPAEKVKLDELERGGYLPEKVHIKLNGRHEEAYTHVPLAMSPEPGHPPARYLDTMIEGATEHRLTQTVAELHAVRRELDD